MTAAKVHGWHHLLAWHRGRLGKCFSMIGCSDGHCDNGVKVMENRRQTQCSNHFAWVCKRSSWEGRRSVQQRIHGKFSFSFYSSCSGRTAAVVLMDEHLSSLAAGVSVRL